MNIKKDYGKYLKDLFGTSEQVKKLYASMT